MFAGLLLSLLWVSSATAQCDGCWCIAWNSTGNTTGVCPSWQPATYTNATINALAAQVPTNPYTLGCNPYSDPGCTTFPPQSPLVNHSAAVCGLVYSHANGSGVCATYTMVTYPDNATAMKDGAFVTHVGACGLCSTTQDLAAYLSNPDMTTTGKRCAIEGNLNPAWGIACYEALGFTHECAVIWNYDGIYDAHACLAICLKDYFVPMNGPPPQCALNGCLQCDEDMAGPAFKAFAGRTRRRSGQVSSIARPCESMARITQLACPN